MKPTDGHVKLAARIVKLCAEQQFGSPVNQIAELLAAHDAELMAHAEDHLLNFDGDCGCFLCKGRGLGTKEQVTSGAEAQERIRELERQVHRLKLNLAGPAIEDRHRRELAQVMEPMACGHPKACWVEEQPAFKREFESFGPRDHIAKEMLGPIPAYCIACEQGAQMRRETLEEVAAKMPRQEDRAWIRALASQSAAEI